MCIKNKSGNMHFPPDIRVIRSKRTKSAGHVTRIGKRERKIERCFESVKKGYCFRHLETDGRIILKLMLEKHSVKVRTEMNWFGRHSSDGPL
jgi:hypothetical protein